MHTGRFITVEGGEGSGKTTQARLLFEALNNAGIPTLLTREPGGTDGAEDIRALLVRGETGRWDRITETLLYFAARRDHVHKFIRPALDRGEWVICDRFTDSTCAYQGYGHGVQLELIHGLHRLILGEFNPDLTLIFDIDAEQGIARAHAREGSIQHRSAEDRYERMGAIFHKNVRRGFIEIAKAEDKRCAVIPAAGSVESIHHTTVSRVQFRFGKPLSELSPPQIAAVLARK